MSHILKAAICVFLGLVLTSNLDAKTRSPSNSLEYKITDLGKISTDEFIVDIYLNNNRFICGDTLPDHSNTFKEFTIKDGIIQVLQPASEFTGCQITALNDKNQLLEVGYNSKNLYGSYLREADGTIHNLVQHEFDEVTASGMNLNGEIVGWFGFYKKAFLYRHDTFTELPNLLPAEFIWCSFINDKQQIAGSTQDKDHHKHGFVTELGGTATDLNDLLGQECVAMGLNNNGDMLLDTTHEGIFLFKEGKFQKLGVSLLNGLGPAVALNDLGDVVGAGAEEIDGFIYHDGQLTDIRELIPDMQQFKLILPHSINNSREIVAIGTVGDWDETNPDFEQHIVLLTPIEE